MKWVTVLTFLMVMLISNFSFAQQNTVSGTVTDASSGETLPGVNIQVKGTTTGTSTDTNGQYELTLESLQDTLAFSYVGYKTWSVSINGRVTIDVKLEPTVITGEQLVVVAFGSQKEQELSTAVSSVSEEEIGDAPVATLGQKLQGKISGVKIKENTGIPGQGLQIKIRGAASVSAGSNPLYVVDGMPLTGGIANMNPDEIKNISVLKGPSATALYGSRASNGVVLVTTKTATPGETTVHFNARGGIEHYPKSRKLDMMNAKEYANFVKSVYEFNGRAVPSEFQNPSQYGKGTDWINEVTKVAPIQDYNLSIGTGSEKANTYASLGYFNQDGIVIGTGYEKFSARINSRFQPTDKLNIGLNVAPTYTQGSNFPTDIGRGRIVGSARLITPLVSPYNSDGSLKLVIDDAASFPHPNWVLVTKDREYDNNDRQIRSNAFIKYEIVDGLMLKTQGNIEFGNHRVFSFTPSSAGFIYAPPPNIPHASKSVSQYYNWSNENTITYKTDIGYHHIEALVGLTEQGFRSEGNNLKGNQYPDDKIHTLNAAPKTSISSQFGSWKLLSYLSRIIYNYNDKYIVQASIRRDGSSRFGPNNRWGSFPSVSAAWNISNENFWNVEPISHLKIRTSYGKTGNFNIGNYSYISSIGTSHYIYGNGLAIGKQLNNLADLGLGWEKNKEIDIGADINLFKNRIKVTYDYYHKKTTNLLYNVKVPTSSGFGSIQTNIGSLNFWGHEISIKSQNISNNSMSWNTNFNISFARNRVVALGSANEKLYSGYGGQSLGASVSEAGKPIGMFNGSINEGVYVNQEDFENSPKFTTSDVGTTKFKDLNGDGVISFPEDETAMGNPWPDFTFGMTNNINYKNFNFSLTLSGSYGNQILAMYESSTMNIDGIFNVEERVKDRWKSPQNPGNGVIPSVEGGTTGLFRDHLNTEMLKDGTYIAFKNITLGYTIPFQEVSRLRIYGTVHNAFFLSNYPAGNPEVNIGNANTLNSIDRNAYPVPRTYSIGINISF